MEAKLNVLISLRVQRRIIKRFGKGALFEEISKESLNTIFYLFLRSGFF